MATPDVDAAERVCIAEKAKGQSESCGENIRGSTREAALASLVDAFESFMLDGLVENNDVMYTDLLQALDCLAVVTFVGATDLAETELSLKAMWDVIHPKSGSNVRMPIAFLSTLLGADDRAVRMAAGEALALCFELNLLDVSACEDDDDDTGVAEAGAKVADKKNLSDLSDQRDLFQRILDFVKYGECPEESLKIAGKRDVLRVSSWSELIQDNGLLQDIFSIRTDKAESLSSSDKERKNAALFNE
ncbi:hypothetical protein ACQ4PT_015864 [Festuca glaucescens]